MCRLSAQPMSTKLNMSDLNRFIIRMELDQALDHSMWPKIIKAVNRLSDDQVREIRDNPEKFKALCVELRLNP